MDDVKKAALEKAIRMTTHPDHSYLNASEICLEKVFEKQAVAWVGDRLFWVPFKEENGVFVLGKLSRVSKADVKKHQLDDGTPMTVAEEKDDDEQFRAATPKGNKDITQPAKEEFQTDPAPNKVAEVSRVAENPNVVPDATNSAAIGDKVAPSTFGDKVNEIPNLAAAPKVEEVAAGYDLMTKHSFTEDQTKVKYLVPSERKLPYTDENGTISHARMGAAWAALHGGYRGNKYAGPDKDKAISRLKGLYSSEGLDLPSEKAEKSIAEKIEASEASLETLHTQFAELMKSFNELTELGETDMTQAEKLQKARATVADNLGKIKKALDTQKAAHAALHAAHDEMYGAHKAFHDAAKKAHDARQVHKAAHDDYVSKVSSGIDEIQKVLGGGPESFGEFGAPDTVRPGGTGAESQDPTYGSEVSTYADKARKDEINKAVADALKAAGVKVPEQKTEAELRAEEIKKAVDEALAKAGVKQGSAAAEPAKTLTEEEQREAIKKAALEGLTLMFSGVNAELEKEAAAGVGNRSQARPFTKAEDGASAADKGADPKDVMVKTDWDLYRQGHPDAIKKAQRATAFKWQPVPDRIMRRRQEVAN